MIKEALLNKNRDIHGFEPVKIAFLGDSVTQGCFECFMKPGNHIDTVNDYEAVYSNRLRQKLQGVFSIPINTVNAGNSGGNSVQALERVERDILSVHPQATVVCLGLNDAMGGRENVHRYGDLLVNIFKKLRQQEMDIFFMTPNRMNDYVDQRLDPQGRLAGIAAETAKVMNEGIMDEYMAEARRAARAEDVRLVDCYAQWTALHDAGVDTTVLLANHINHPTREMHGLFADALFNAILF